MRRALVLLLLPGPVRAQPAAVAPSAVRAPAPAGGPELMLAQQRHSLAMKVARWAQDNPAKLANAAEPYCALQEELERADARALAFLGDCLRWLDDRRAFGRCPPSVRRPQPGRCAAVEAGNQRAELERHEERGAAALGLTSASFEERWSGAAPPGAAPAPAPAAAPMNAPALRAATAPPKPWLLRDDIPTARERLSEVGGQVWNAAKGVYEWATAPAPAPDALAAERSRALTPVAGLDDFVVLYRPQDEAELRRLKREVKDAGSADALRSAEDQLIALRRRVMEAARAEIPERGSADELLAPAQRLDTARWKARVSALARNMRPQDVPFQRLSISPEGRLLASAPEDWSAARWMEYVNHRLPLEAEIVLGSRLPVISLERASPRAMILRGEDYGLDAGVVAAREELRAREEGAAKAESERAEAEGALLRGREALEPARRLEAERRADAERALADAEAAKAAAEAAAAAAEREAAQARRAEAEAKAARDSSADEIRRALLSLPQGIDLELLFEYGSARVMERDFAQLERLAEALRSPELEPLDILIFGHTDARGGAAYNVGLSRRRAEAVRDHLVIKHGVPMGRLTAEGFGSQRLKLPSQPFSERNRRVQISARGAEAALQAARAELEARQAERLSGLELAAAESAQKAAELAGAAAESLEARRRALERISETQRTLRQSSDGLAALERRVQSLTAALPKLEDAKAAADRTALSARRALSRAEEGGEGVLLVRDYRAYHLSLFETPKDLAKRFAQTLTHGYEGHGPQGALLRKAFSGAHRKTGRTLAQDVAEEMERMERAKGALAAIKEGLGDAFNLLSGRWIEAAGRVGRGATFNVMSLVPESPEPPKPKVVTIESVITADELTRLSVRETPSMAPDPGAAAAGEQRGPAPGSPAETGPGQPESDAEAAALETRRQLEAAERLRADAERAAREARRLRGSARASAESARLLGASAAQIRGALTQGRTRRVQLNVPFAYDSAELAPEAIAQLVELGRALASDELRRERIVIEGHTDASGGREYNLALSRRRAQAVRDFLLARFGGEPERFIAQGHGFDRPRNPADPRAGENRRVEIAVAR